MIFLIDTFYCQLFSLSVFLLVIAALVIIPEWKSLVKSTDEWLFTDLLCSVLMWPGFDALCCPLVFTQFEPERLLDIFKQHWLMLYFGCEIWVIVSRHLDGAEHPKVHTVAESRASDGTDLRMI